MSTYREYVVWIKIKNGTRIDRWSAWDTSPRRAARQALAATFPRRYSLRAACVQVEWQGREPRAVPRMRVYPIRYVWEV